MSTIKFLHQGEKILEILAGWDPALKRHFMVVSEVLDHEEDYDEEESSEDENENYDEYDIGHIWSNLDHHESKMNMDNYMFVLREMGISPPEGFRVLCEKNERESEYVWENNKWIKVR